MVICQSVNFSYHINSATSSNKSSSNKNFHRCFFGTILVSSISVVLMISMNSMRPILPRHSIGVHCCKKYKRNAWLNKLISLHSETAPCSWLLLLVSDFNYNIHLANRFFVLHIYIVLFCIIEELSLINFELRKLMDLLSFLVSSVNFIVVLMVDLDRELDILNYLG